MIHGLDTGFLVAAEVREHADHAGARVTLTQVLSAGDACAMRGISAVFRARLLLQDTDMIGIQQKPHGDLVLGRPVRLADRSAKSQHFVKGRFVLHGADNAV